MAEFRAQVRGWLRSRLTGRFEPLMGRGGPADEQMWELSLEWERELARGGWTALGWPREFGGRGLGPVEQVTFYEEYALANAPGRVTHLGEMMLGPTLIELGTPEQQRRFLPGIKNATELWCQGYSEPDAGSDLAAVRTRAQLRGDDWVISGTKVWTSLAQHADFCFVLCRTGPFESRHRGLTYLLVPMRQPGVTVRPIRQMTGTREFNEVTFDEAVTPASWRVGAVDGGWPVAMATLGYERSRRLAHFPIMRAELDGVIALARSRGRASDPHIRERIARSYSELLVMRTMNERTLAALAAGRAPGAAASIGKLYWSHWHQRLLDLQADVLGLESQLLAGDPYQVTAAQQALLYSRAETIFAGSSEIQRNIIAERVLGLPKDT
jgi:alkylation response protein AidB-like acyl-CoA dehydrogenase